MFLKRTIPYHITEAIAHQLWNTYKDLYQSYDIILTSDTVALSYIFLLHLEELKPHLIILNCNRYSYAMEHEPKFTQLLQMVQNNAAKYLSKVTYIPYTDFERIWCGKNQIYLHERAIMPIGKYTKHINDANDILDCFKPTDTQYRTKDIGETIFLQNYHNYSQFMNLSKYLYDNCISVDKGSYVNLEEIKAYKAMVVLPDQFSKYFTYESIQEDIVVFMPSAKFLMELVKKPGYYFSIEGSSGLLTPEFVNLCEWYKYPETRIYFDSFDEMVQLIHGLTPARIESIRQWCQFYGKVIIEEHTTQWKNIINKISLHKQNNASAHPKQTL